MTHHHRIAFGSCNEQDKVNHLWPVIESREPVAFVWGGDAIYADKNLGIQFDRFPPSFPAKHATPQRLKTLYRKQRQVPGYKRIIDKNITIFGTLDDHDFGINNGDSTFPYRVESGIEFVKFLGQPVESAMSWRAHQGHGVYGVKLFDFARAPGSIQVPDEEAGIDPDIPFAFTTQKTTHISDRSVAVFVLDVRTHKSPWKHGSAAFQPDFDGDFLGERQWQWLEQALARSPAAVNVVVNGLQVHANRFPDANTAESWDKFPRSQQRLFDLLLRDGVSSPILISGDVHMTQLMRKDCVPVGQPQTTPRPLLELTTSGMTHSWGTTTNAPLHRPGKLPSLFRQYQSFASQVLMHAMHMALPWTEIVYAEPSQVEQGNYENGNADPAATMGLQYSLEKNFGELEFDWEQREVTVRSIGEDGKPLLASRVSMDQLSGTKPMSSQFLSEQDFLVAESAQNQALPGSDWVCVNYRGAPTSSAWGYLHAIAVVITIAPLPLVIPVLLLWIARNFLRRPRSKQRMISTIRRDRSLPKLTSASSVCSESFSSDESL